MLRSLMLCSPAPTERRRTPPRFSTNVVAVAVVGTPFTCNPNFQIWQVGTVTRWTPVKNLTFSGEVMYTALDQQYAGVVNLPAIGALAKPGAPYELKDQSTWTFLARAQRNF